METSKYYTPTIDEFHVGFEFELLGSIMKIDSIHDIELALENPVRVKYLDQEDIESLRFRYYEKGFGDGSSIYRHGKGFELTCIGDTIKLIQIVNQYSNIKFEGYIKNKSELIKILKMLRI